MILSIIIPVYRREIATTLASLIPLPLDCEVIVVDDASPTPVTLSEQDFNGQVRLILLKENGGPGVARNSGLDACRGDFVAFLDSDDSYSPGMLERLVPQLRSADWDVGLFSLKEVKSGSSRIRRAKTPAAAPIFDETLAGRLMTMSAVDKVYRRSFLLANQIRFPGWRGYEDISFVREVARADPRIKTFPHLMYVANLGEDSVSRNVKSNFHALHSLVNDPTAKELSLEQRKRISASNNRVIIFEIHRFARRATSYRRFIDELGRLSPLLDAGPLPTDMVGFKYLLLGALIRFPLIVYLTNKLLHRPGS